MLSRLGIVGLMIALAGGCGPSGKMTVSGGSGGSAGSGGSVGSGGSGGSGTGGAAAGSGGSSADAAVTTDSAGDAPGADVASGDVAADLAVDSKPPIGMVTLVADDKPGVTPCPSQAILLEQSQFADLKTAMRDGVVTYLDVPFNGADPNIYKKKCGFETFFDPATNTDMIPVAGSPKLATILMTGHGGICADGFSGNFGADDGFPGQGVYRKEFKVAHMGRTYHVRARVTARGPAAGQKFSAHGIAVPADIQNTLVYRLAMMPTTHDNLWPTIANLLSSDGTVFPGVDLAVDKGGTALFQAKLELICAARM